MTTTDDGRADDYSLEVVVAEAAANEHPTPEQHDSWALSFPSVLVPGGGDDDEAAADGDEVDDGCVETIVPLDPSCFPK